MRMRDGYRDRRADAAEEGDVGHGHDDVCDDDRDARREDRLAGPAHGYGDALLGGPPWPLLPGPSELEHASSRRRGPGPAGRSARGEEGQRPVARYRRPRSRSPAGRSRWPSRQRGPGTMAASGARSRARRSQSGSDHTGDDRYPDDGPEDLGDVRSEHCGSGDVVGSERRDDELTIVSPERGYHACRVGGSREVVDHDHRPVVGADEVLVREWDRTSGYWR